MSVQETTVDEVLRAAYALAWQKFKGMESLTPDELQYGPSRLRWYIKVMAEIGERDPAKIANSALGMVREYEQISRSRARIESAVRLASISQK